MEPHAGGLGGVPGTPGTISGHPDADEIAYDEVADRFEMVALIGRGAYGSVYRAIDRASGRSVAVKIITLTDSDPQDLDRIRKEIAFLSECDHPNVVRYLGSYRRPDCLWIVMEHCGGGSVGDLIAANGGGLSEEVIAYICSEALKGLAYLHSLGKVHRDIKCGNILLSEAGQVKLADFGVAAQLTSTMTKRNTFIGTPHWMAPEVIQESRYDGKVDVWALGVSAMEMAEVTPPRWMVHPLRVIFMISREPAPTLQDQEKWSAAFHDFLAQALQKDPAQRPTAQGLQSHRFVADQQPAAAKALEPLLGQVQAYLAQRVTPAGTLRGTMGGTLRRRDGGGTGRFSWRAGAARGGGPGGAGASGGSGGAMSDEAYGTVIERGGTAAAGAGRGPGQLHEPPGGAGASGGPQSSGWGDTVVAPRRRFAAEAGDTMVAIGGSAGAAASAAAASGTVVVRGRETATGPTSLAAALASARRAMAEAVADDPGPRHSDSGDSGGATPEAQQVAGTATAAAAGWATTGAGSVRQREPPASARTERVGFDAVLPPLRASAVDDGDEEGGSYLMALRSAAADREREQYQLQQRGGGAGAGSAGGLPARTPSPGRLVGAGRDASGATAPLTAGPGGAAAAAAAATPGVRGDAAAAAGAAAVAADPAESLLRRLQALFESGAAVPLPFLSAAHAAPLALFNAPHSPTVTPHGLRGGVKGVDAEAYRAVSLLLSEGPEGPGGSLETSGSGDGDIAGSSTVPGCEPLRPLPPAVVAKLLQNPGLQNLARELAYHGSTLRALPLDRGAAVEAARVAEDMATVLRTALSVGL